MRAVTARLAGGPGVLRMEDHPARSPGPRHIAVDVAASGVNYIDVYQRSGLYPVPLPFVPGLEGAGVVRSVGDRVRGVRPGDRVAWSDGQGSYAERVILDPERVVPVPDELPLTAAAAVML